MLKKSVSYLGSIFFILFLTACNEEASPVSKNGNEVAKAEETKNGESELTAKEVYKKMVEASSEVKSLGLKLDIDQEISTEADGIILTTETRTDSKMIQEPLSLYQQIEIYYKNPATGEQEGKIDQYLTDEGFFMHDIEGDQWGRYNADYTEVAKGLNLQPGTNQLDSLKDLESFADDFTFEQEADQYVLTLAGNDEKLNEYVKGSLPANIPELETALKSMTLQEVEYEIFIDKNTFLPSVMNVDMNIGISENGNSLVLEQSIESSYYDYNKIDKIVLPKEALDNPNEINLNDTTSM
ncbi:MULTISPECIES: DUF6612 family protein [unclassified Bacillus (in: firmicutes)]|uniref:DUF6612 family protein n=1 Tax=unclassified Bacillus (in: firmicutes) TaxID=185979 RepID=UPI00080AF151|nr:MULTISPECIES: DUF6612 family protein [unclassified Bacillus (in: firmicutes)]OCA89488.1 hypothetical protein A8L44_00610 [Bacillus sp. FJAT-27986]